MAQTRLYLAESILRRGNSDLHKKGGWSLLVPKGVTLDEFLIKLF